MPNVHAIIRQHVSLSIRCIDRLYLHAYMPKLQTSGGLCYFLRDYLGHPIPSPALFKPMHDRFVAAVERLRTPRSSSADRASSPASAKMRRRRLTALASPPARASSCIGVAQEKMRSFKAHKRPGPQGERHASTSRGNRSPSITTTSTSRIATGARRF